MTRPLRDMVRMVHARARDFFDAPLTADAQPIELLQAALDELERKTQPSGRGSRTFPYARIAVHIVQPHADRPAIDAVFSRLETRLRERLAEMRCDIPASLAVTVSVTDSASRDQPVLRVDCDDDRDASHGPRADLPELRVVVVKGQCDREKYAFAGGVIAIGRGAEPADAFGRVRRNDIAFLDARDGVTETVARAHARLEFDPALFAYVLFNESTTNPTSILRGGRSLRLNPRDPRGVRIQSGDELQVGRAVLSVSISDTDSARRPAFRRTPDKSG
ncbi:MAG TPA: FHA domain-containing protein [Vicinamibacterales bacterium]|nr:FHA domain-containing protein [Vicinamibacterales bacterium]